MSGNLVELVGARAAGRADHPCLRTLDGTVWSYGDVLARAARYAAALRGLGVQPDDRVAVQVDKSAEVLALYLGCLHAGAVFLPLNTAYTEAEVAYFLGDAEPRVAVCRPTAAEAFGRIVASGSAAHVETMGADGSGSMATRADQADPDLPMAPRAAGDLAAILYTSGTTGRSKGAMLTHGNLTSNADALIGAWRFSAEDVLLHALPLFHSHGLFVASNVVLLSGASMVLLPAFDVDTVLRLLPEATVMMGVPTLYSRLLASPGLTRELVDHVRLFTSGSAPLSPEHHRAFEARTGQVILERYGMTETNMNTSNPYDRERRPGTVGFPLPGVEIRVVDRRSGAPVPDGEVGVVEIRGPNVFRGYWRMPEKTATELHDDGFFVSGDLGRVDEDGYLWLVGRTRTW